MTHLNIILSLIVLTSPLCLLSQKLDSIPMANKPKWDLEMGAINDSWGGGFSQINDDARSFGLYVNFDKNQLWGVNTLYSGITNKSFADTTLSSRIDEWRIEGYYQLIREAAGWFNLRGLGGIVISGNLGGQKFQNSTTFLFGVDKVTLPYSNFEGVFTHVGFLANTAPLKIGGGTKLFYAIEPTLKTTYTLGYEYVLDARLPIGIYDYYHDRLAIELFYRHTESLTNDRALQNMAAKESGLGFGLNRNAGGFRVFWNTFLQSDYSLGGLALCFQGKKDRKPFQKADVIMEFGLFSEGLGYYNKYHWNDTKLWNNHLKFSFLHSYGTYRSNYLKEYPDVTGHYSQTEVGGFVHIFEEKPKFQLNPKFGLNAGFKKESYYAGRDVTALPLKASGLVVHGEAGLTMSFPLIFLSQNALYGLNMTYNYNLSFSERQEILHGKPQTVLPSYGWLSLGFIVQLDL